MLSKGCVLRQRLGRWKVHPGGGHGGYLLILLVDCTHHDVLNWGHTKKSDSNGQLSPCTAAESYYSQMFIHCDVERSEDSVDVPFDVLETLHSGIETESLSNSQIVDRVILRTNSDVKSRLLWLARNRYAVQVDVTEVRLQLSADHVDHCRFPCAIAT